MYSEVLLQMIISLKYPTADKGNDRLKGNKQTLYIQ